MNLPGQSSTTINDLIPGVQLALQNRSDILNYNPAKYIKDSIKELTLKYPFEELRTTGPVKTLTVKQYNYQISFFTNLSDDYTMPVSVNVFVDFPLNTIAVPAHYETPTGIEVLLRIPGLPAKWTRYGSEIWLGPAPDRTYSAFMRYQIRHAFNELDLVASVIFMPDSWFDVLEYCAAYRMAAGPLRWPDQAKFLYQMLYGDPNDMDGQPGLIKSRAVQQKLDQQFHSRNFTQVVSRY